MSFIAEQVAAMRNQKQMSIKTTLLHRPGGKWQHDEIGRIANAFLTEVSWNPQHPEYLIFSGHRTQEEVDAAVLTSVYGGTTFTVAQMTGVERLPFAPHFI